jgi:hypothetical protein
VPEGSTLRVAPTYIDCGKLMAELLRECGSAADGIIVFRGDPSPAELLALLREAPVVLNGHMTIDAALLAAAPN